MLVTAIRERAKIVCAGRLHRFRFARVALAGFALAGLAASSSAQPFTCSGLSLNVSSSGKVAEFRDTVTNINRVTPLADYQPYLCAAIASGIAHNPTGMTRSGDRLTFTFGTLTPVPQVTIQITSGGNHLVLRVDSASNLDAIQSIRFLNLSTQDSLSAMPNRFVEYRDNGVVRRVLIQSLDIFTQTATGGGDGSGGPIWATAYKSLPYPTAVGVVGRRVAVMACGDDASVRAGLRSIESTYAIPLGQASQDVPATDRSCMFWVGIHSAMRDQAIQWSQDAGVGRILLSAPVWQSPTDVGGVGPEWGSVAGLQAWVQQCRGRGLPVGAHLFPSLVYSGSNNYVRNGVDPRIRRDRTISLAAALDPSQTDGLIQTATPPTGWPTGARERDLVINGEIIEYTSLALNPPYGFRGPFTRAKHQSGAGLPGPQSHSAGATVARLVPSRDDYGYTWDIASGGVQQHAADLAGVMNQVGFESVYFDALEAAEEPAWYVQNVLNKTLLDQLSPAPLYTEASGLAGAMSSSLITLAGQIDNRWLYSSFKSEINRCLFELEQSSVRLAKKQLGWGMFSWGLNYHTRPDDIEYICAKSIAYGYPIVWHAHTDSMNVWPMRDQNLLLIRTYEDLRRGNYFDSATRQAARQINKDFFLIRDDSNNYHLAPMSPLVVAEMSSKVRAFISDKPILGYRVVSLHPASLSQPVDLLLDARQTSDVQVRDAAGNSIPVTIAAHGQIRIPITERVYIWLINLPDPVQTIGAGSIRPR